MTLCTITLRDQAFSSFQDCRAVCRNRLVESLRPRPTVTETEWKVCVEKLEAEVEALFSLTTRAYSRFLFLRPMLASEKLTKRFGEQRKGVAFNRLRQWLYWSLVQELSKICSDNDSRSPSIAAITRKLKDSEVRSHLQQKCVTKNREMGEERVRTDFNASYDHYLQHADELLSSHSVGGYKTVRDKLISHNELRRSATGYDFFDVRDAKLKYGDERKMLETLAQLIEDLELVVRNVSFDWSSWFRNEKKFVGDFWDVGKSEL
jgi:hypothetical protein